MVEIKKDTSNIGCDYDLVKLHAFKKQLAYKHTAFIEFKTGNAPGVGAVIFDGKKLVRSEPSR